MKPSPDYEGRVDRRDRWLPPKKRGSNRIRTRPMTGQNVQVPLEATFYHNEAATNGSTTIRLSPEQWTYYHGRRSTTPYKTCSIYHNLGLIHTVDYDATRKKVGDGKHDDGESSSDSEDADSQDEGEEYDDWREMSFCRVSAGMQSLSYAGRHLPERRLLGQHQNLVQHLVPDRYHFRPPPPAGSSTSFGVVGDLPLLIGLASLSLPTYEWPNSLPQTIVNHGWRTSHYHHTHPHGEQWLDKRGIVVKVFRDLQGSLEEELQGYERGARGPILI